MKRTSTIIGIICGAAAIFGAFLWEGGTMGALFMLPAMLIVFGGTLAAGAAGTTFDHLKRLPALMSIACFPPRHNIRKYINKIVEFAALARKEGILSIESRLKEIEHPFLKKLFTLCIDGVDPDSLKRIVETEVNFITERHNSNISLFVKMGGYSPTMGIIGTVMGLISTLAAVGTDPNNLIHNVASAFIATMWGIFMANIVWLPIGDKLRTLHNEEMQLLQVMLDGVLSVQLGEVPSVIRAKLASAFPISEQEAVMEEARRFQAKYPVPTKIINDKEPKHTKPENHVPAITINPIKPEN